MKLGKKVACVGALRKTEILSRLLSFLFVLNVLYGTTRCKKIKKPIDKDFCLWHNNTNTKQKLR